MVVNLYGALDSSHDGDSNDVRVRLTVKKEKQKSVSTPIEWVKVRCEGAVRRSGPRRKRGGSGVDDEFAREAFVLCASSRSVTDVGVCSVGHCN